MDAIETRQSWIVLLAVAASGAFGLLSLLPAMLPALTTFIEADTGWSRTLVTSAVSLTVIGGALMAPWIGDMVDRHGARPILIGGQTIVIVAMALVGLLGNSLAAYFIGFIIAGFGTAALTPTVFMRVIAQWFDQRRGLAMGLSTLGASAVTIALPIISVKIAQAYGWHFNFLLIAGFSALVALPATLIFVHDRPVAGAATATATAVRAADRPHFLKAIWRLWRTEKLIGTLTMSCFLIGVGVTAIVFAIAPMMVDRGMTPAQAAAVQATAGLATIFGKVFGGMLFDYFQSARPLLFGISLTILGIIGFALGAVGPAAYACSFLIGFSGGVENDAPPYLVSRYFAVTDFGKIAASITTLSITALAFGPLIGSVLRDLTGNYTATCIAAATILLLAAYVNTRLPAFTRAHGRVDIATVMDQM